jgi:hypothetical protein
MGTPKTSICFYTLPLVDRKPLTMDKIDTSISGGISDIEHAASEEMERLGKATYKAKPRRVAAGEPSRGNEQDGRSSL